MAPEHWSPYLFQLAGVAAGTEQLATLSPQLVKTRIVETLVQMSLNGAQRRPLVVEVENLHWIDPSSEEVLGALVERLAGARILLLLTYRPGYQPLWMDRSYATQLALTPLNRQDSRRVVRALMRTGALPEPTLDAIIARADGNPLFLEELTLTVVEQADPSQQSVVPTTLQAVLTARIDRLAPDTKWLLQVAAVIGKESSLPLLQAVVEMPVEQLQQHLRHLETAELLYATTWAATATVTFKHVLIREAAYQSLLEETRQQVHGRVMEALEALYPDHLGEHVEWLAYHALRGEIWEKTVVYLRQAGTKAYERAANREAVACFEQALAALRHLPESHQTRQQAIDLRFDLRTPLMALGDLEQALDHLRQAETLAETLGDHVRLGSVSSYMSYYYCLMADYDRALETGQRALALATTLGNVSLTIRTNYYLAMIYRGLGAYRQAQDCLMSNIVSLQGDLARYRFGLAGHAAVACRVVWAGCAAERGEFAAGITHGEEAARIAEETGHPYDLVMVAHGLGHLYLRQGDTHKAIPVLERGLSLCEAMHFLTMFPLVAPRLGYAYTLAGRAAEGVPLLLQAVEQASAMARMEVHALRCAWLGEACLAAGHIHDAIKYAMQALELSRKYKERGNQAWALWLLGEIAVQRQSPEIELAEASYQQALALAEELEMRPLLAHCHLGLGRRYRQLGRREQARAHLCTAVELMRAMEMTLWLPQAAAELAQAT
jgi:predicted ATPase